MEERFPNWSQSSVVSLPNSRQPLSDHLEGQPPHPGSVSPGSSPSRRVKPSPQLKRKSPQSSPRSTSSKVTPLRVMDGGFASSPPVPQPSYSVPDFRPPAPELPQPSLHRPQTPISPIPPVGVRRPTRVRRRPTHPLILATRYLILGIGMAVISGTLLSILGSLSQANLPTQSSSSVEIAEGDVSSSKTQKNKASLGLKLNQEITDLHKSLEGLVKEYPQANPGIFLVDLERGDYVNLQGEIGLPSASTIKLPILFAFFQAVDEGRVQLNQLLKLKPEHIAGGSGDLQNQTPGREFTALEVVKKMIIISDNTATNMIIELLGGQGRLNQQFQQWGLTQTVINNPLPDVEGTNKTSGKDLIEVLSKIEKGDSISGKSRDWMLYIMRQTKNDSLLPKGLGNDQAIIAHKTGYINGLLGDAGMIDLPNGKRYLLAVLVKYSGSKKKTEKLIREVSSLVYESLNQTPKKQTLSPQEPATIPLPNRARSTESPSKKRDF